MTPDEWRMWERMKGASNSEEEWLACPAADCLLGRLLELGASERKLRLFGCACCRLIWHNLVRPESRAAVEAAERFAVGEISAEVMQEASDKASAVLPRDNPPRVTDRGRREEFVEYIAGVSAAEVACAENEGGWPYWERLVDIPGHALQVSGHQRFGLDEAAMEATLCDRLRDIVGNPYRAVVVAPEWQTPAVRSLARGILADRAFERLPVLADALEESGCSGELLAHCRGQRTHVLGCWAVDLLLGYRWRGQAEPSAAADSPRDRRFGEL